MGLIHPGIARKLALALKSIAGLIDFMETGTFHGDIPHGLRRALLNVSYRSIARKMQRRSL
jgi:hypothetical protein